MIFPTFAPPITRPPSFVLDASVVATWGVPRRHVVYTHRVRSQLASGVALTTATWPFDVAEQLLAAVQRGETTRLRADALLTGLSGFQLYIDDEGPFRVRPTMLDLARTHDVSVRDAAYLELALRTALPLATVDATLTRAAVAARVTIFTP